MKNINEDNDRYFYIRFEGQKSFYTIQESKRLMKDEYHEAKRKETSKYYILMETEKTVGSDLPDFGINKEEYSAYEFKKVGYEVANDFGLDGFIYDMEREIILYGLITGIPTIKKPDGYYDMVTDTRIPHTIIESVKEVEQVDDYGILLSDLKIIMKNIEAYRKGLNDNINKLLEGINNKKQATKRYERKYSQVIRQQILMKKIEEQKCQELKNEARKKTATKREEVKQLIIRLKQSNQSV